MTKTELKNEFTSALDTFSDTVQTYLNSCHCDEDTKMALDEIARQCFYALASTQEAIMKYIEKN